MRETQQIIDALKSPDDLTMRESRELMEQAASQLRQWHDGYVEVSGKFESADKALRQLLGESQTSIDFAVEHELEKATAMLFAARTKEICLKGLGEKYDSGQ